MVGQLFHNEQTAANVSAAWTGWNFLSQAGDEATALALAAHPDERMHAVMAGLDSQVRHNEQTAVGVSAAWTGWNLLSQARRLRLPTSCPEVEFPRKATECCARQVPPCSGSESSRGSFSVR
jgi:hypothetical protein